MNSMGPHSAQPHPGGVVTPILLIGTSESVRPLLEQLRRHRRSTSPGGADAPADPAAEAWLIVLWNESPGAAPRGRGQLDGVPVVGSLGGQPEGLHDIVRRLGPNPPSIALVSMPATMSGAIQRVRTVLRRLGIADRFVPTFEDLVNGVGPRTQLDLDPVRLIGRSPHQLDETAIAEAIGGKRVLITGAGGSIGGELARLVARFEPAALLLMERSENALFEIDRQIARRHPRLARRAWLHDVTDGPRTRAYCVAARPQVIFHAAAHKHVPLMEDHPVLAVVNNVYGTRAIADAAVATACERFVFISTDKAVRPRSVMGATKRIAELYTQYLNGRSDTRFSIVRFGNVIGSAGSVLPTWLDQIREGGPVTVTDPEMTRYFMTIPEAAGLVLSAASLEDEVARGRGGEVRILDMGQPIRVLDLACRVIEAHGLTPVVHSDAAEYAQGGAGAALSPAAVRSALDECFAGAGTDSSRTAAAIPVIFTGVRPGEKLHEELSYGREHLTPTSHPGIHVWESEPPAAALITDIMSILHEAVDAALDRPDFVSAQRLIDVLRFVVPESSLEHHESTVLPLPLEAARAACRSPRAMDGHLGKGPHTVGPSGTDGAVGERHSNVAGRPSTISAA